MSTDEANEPESANAARSSGESSQVAIEFLIEPFTEGTPGPHVQAALGAFDDRSLSVELGPFASSVTGDLDEVADALADAMRRAVRAGATNLRIQVAPDPLAMRARNLHQALPEMLRELEQDHGPVEGWNRETKQSAVRTLSERGAFLLRGAIEEVADAMGVSRITIYNYLNAVE